MSEYMKDSKCPECQTEMLFITAFDHTRYRPLENPNKITMLLLQCPKCKRIKVV